MQANQILASIPPHHHNKIARFLEGQGHKEAALQVATDPEHKFELALQLEKFEVALALMREEISQSSPAGTGLALDEGGVDCYARRADANPGRPTSGSSSGTWR